MSVKNLPPCATACLHTIVMTSMEIEKEIASNNNNISSVQNKWSRINFAPRTNKLADIK